MFNLSSIIQSAHGGQAVDSLSSQFGLSSGQTQSALDALMPALQMGLQNKIESGGIGGLLGHLGSAVHQGAYQDAGTAQSGATAAQGGSILGELFNGGQLSQIIQQVANESGVPASVIQSMLPVIASMLIGGLTSGGHGGAFGGILSSVLGSIAGQQGNAGEAPASGGIGGMLGGLLGGLLGGGGGPPASAPQQSGPPTAAPDDGSGTLAEISSMIEAGSPTSPNHQSVLANILGR